MFSIQTIAALASLASLASAQYSGFIFYGDKGSCPKQVESDPQQPFTYDASSGNLCFANSYGKNSLDISLSAALIGTNAIQPKRLAACPSAGCANGCVDQDISGGGNGFRIDCASFDDAAYIYIGQ